MKREKKIENILKIIKDISKNGMAKKAILVLLTGILDLRSNPFHPLVFVGGKPKIGKNVHIGLFSEINAKGARVVIGDNCDIASFVSINVSDSHRRCIGLSKRITRSSIIIESNIFVGSHSFIGGNTHIGHHSVVGAGTILINGGNIPPYSLIIGNPAQIKKGYYENRHFISLSKTNK
jgi:acetyltransferase-like isoleucine patch superfamily enzyme